MRLSILRPFGREFLGWRIAEEEKASIVHARTRLAFPFDDRDMTPNEFIAIFKMSLKVAPAAFLLYFGARFVLYNEDGPNLDRFFRKRVEGIWRRYSKHPEKEAFFDPAVRDRRFRVFTQSVGAFCLVGFLAYFSLVVVPMVPRSMVESLFRIAG